MAIILMIISDLKAPFPPYRNVYQIIYTAIIHEAFTNMLVEKY